MTLLSTRSITSCLEVFPVDFSSSSKVGEEVVAEDFLALGEIFLFLILFKCVPHFEFPKLTKLKLPLLLEEVGIA